MGPANKPDPIEGLPEGSEVKGRVVGGEGNEMSQVLAVIKLKWPVGATCCSVTHPIGCALPLFIRTTNLMTF